MGMLATGCWWSEAMWIYDNLCFNKISILFQEIYVFLQIDNKNKMESVVTQNRPSVRMLRHTTEHNDAQTKATPKERLRTVEEFVEQLEQAVQKRL